MNPTCLSSLAFEVLAPCAAAEPHTTGPKELMYSQ